MEGNLGNAREVSFDPFLSFVFFSFLFSFPPGTGLPFPFIYSDIYTTLFVLVGRPYIFSLLPLFPSFQNSLVFWSQAECGRWRLTFERQMKGRTRSHVATRLPFYVRGCLSLLLIDAREKSREREV